MKRRLIEISKKISVSLLMVALTTTSLPMNAIADEVIVDGEQSEETTDDAVELTLSSDISSNVSSIPSYC